MKVIKKIVFPIISAFLLVKTIELIKELIAHDPQKLALIWAFLLCLYITGIFAFLGFAYATHQLLPRRYFTLNNPRRLQRAYRSLGVKHFKKMLLWVFWGRHKNRQKYFDGSRKGLNNFVYQTKQSEVGHATAFITILGVSLLLLLHGRVVVFVGMSIINIIGNLYPVILQRYHRLRIERLIKRAPYFRAEVSVNN
ncbi:MAG: hypothetical protein OER04_04730 [Cyclobacteriaceae bacterium]|nr:hypothetical protein [Cyclobacteriaceae bacterium]